MYVLGVDFGGGASKATLMNQNGEVVRTASTEYPTDYGEGGRAEQNPYDWYSAALTNIRKVLEGLDPSLVDCLCFDAATHTAVLLGEDGEPVCPSIYWTDTRATEEKRFLEERFGDVLFARCKHRVDTIWTLPQILFLKNKLPRVFEKVKRITFAKDFVRGKFTGDFVTDRIEAEGSMFFDFDKRKWDSELLALAGLTVEQMPTVVSPLDFVGKVGREAALASGLVEGSPVICGATDTAMEVLAAGAVRPGDATLKLATAGRICVVSEGFYPDTNIINYSHLKDGLAYPGSATKSCAASLRWFRDTFGGEYAAFDEMAERVAIGCDGLLFHPYLMGELTPYADPTLRASFIGFGASHTKAHFARAVMEGVAMSLRDCKQYLEEHGIAIKDRVFVIGGGAKSALWRRIVSDALNITLVVTERNDSSLGSCLCAGVASGYFASLEEAVAHTQKIVTEVTPIPENTEIYNKLFAKYKKIGKFLSELKD
ncbi:MAG: xylulokinase [Clostridia bacterium]|nr:xylulokinase [Clostridia bacterium]